ncbi:MAG: protein kinase [Myxococcales bacterium]|nr:protein kinase [Myxococcales bacterium]
MAAEATDGTKPPQEELDATAELGRAPSASGERHISPGDIIDNRYRVEGVLGEGGMGVVYRAEHIAIARPVAIKLLHGPLAALPEVRARFEREALAIGRISHPNCVDVSDFGQLADGSLYLVMEYLDGKPLTELLHHGPLEPGRALHILKHILRGLAHAHHMGIVHRDVKPANVFVVRQGHDDAFAKIVDFGIAKLVGPTTTTDVNLTQAGIAFGTPVYMSPEQAMGEPADARSDLYSASVVAYEMLAGAPPFVSDDKLDLMGMHANRPPPPLHATRDQFFATQSDPVAPAALVELDALIRRGLEKRPNVRYASAAAYLEAIEQLETEIADFANVRPRRWTVRKRLGLALLVALSLAALGWFFVPRKPGLPTPTPDSAAGKAAAQLERGNPNAAIATVKQSKAANEDPLAQAQLGHALASNRDYKGALKAYRRAIELEPLLRDEPTLRANLAAMETEPDAATKLAAWWFGVEVLDDARASEQLLGAALAPDARLRQLTRLSLEKHSLAPRVDWVGSYLQDLQLLPSCAERKTAIAKLRALGDKQAAAPLRAAAAAKGNKCLAADAQSAVRFLSQVK